MKLKPLLMAFMGIMSLSLAMTGCTADDESTEPSGAKYAYTKAELQEIADLQEEYGVELTDFTKESDEPLPTVDDMHELIAQIAEMQRTLKHATSREDGRVVFSNENRKVRMHRMTPKRDVETYTGEHSENNSCAYGTYNFTFTWKNVDLTGTLGTLNFTHSEESNSKWDFWLAHSNYQFSGAHWIEYRLTYMAKKKDIVNSDPVYFRLHDSFSL